MAFDAHMRLTSDNPDRIALICASSREQISYKTLSDRIELFALRLEAGRGVVLIETDNSVNAVFAYLASLHAQCPALLVDAQATAQKQQLLEQFPVLYVYAAHDDSLDIRQAHRDTPLHPDLALLLSTSGSTGQQKLVRLSHQNLRSNAEAICRYLELTHGDCAPTGLPMDYSFGLSVINSHLHADGRLLVTGKSLIEDAFWADFRAHNCTSFSGVPEHFKLIEKTGLFPTDAPSLRYVTQAGGRLSPDRVEALARQGDADGWAFYVMYGQTEAAPRLSYLPPHLAASRPGSIGRAIPGGRLSLIDADGNAITRPGITGELVYHGPNVMMGYATTKDDLARPPETDCLRTGDLASFDADGLFTLQGRAARFLKIAGKRVSLDAVEERLASQGIEGLATGRDDFLGLVLTKVSDAESVAADLSEELGIPASRLHTCSTEHIPFKANGKPDYQTALALIEASAKPETRVEGPRLQQILAAFREQFPGERISPETSFDELEASSIEFVDLEIRLGAILSDLPQGWHQLSIAELDTHEDTSIAKATPRFYDMAALRSLGTLLVVLIHIVGDKPETGLRLERDSLLFATFDMLSYLSMPLYTLLAGLSFAMLGRTEMSPARFLSHTVRTVVIPTLIAMFTFAAISTVMGTRFGIFGLDQLIDTLVMPYAHFWFINAFIMMSGGAYLIWRVAGERALWIAITLGCLPILTPFALPEDIWATNRMLAILPFFVLGLVLTRFEHVLEKTRWWLLGAALLTATALYPMAYAYMQDTQLTANFRSWNGFLLSLSLIIIVMHASPALRWLRPLAAYSFAIYLWHVFGTSATRRLLEGMGLDNPALHLVAGLIMGLGLPVLLYHVLQYIPLGHIVLGQRAGRRKTPD